MKTKKVDSRKPSGNPDRLAPKTKPWFLWVMLAIPLVFFLLLETGLQLGNYRGNLDLFMPINWQGKDFYQINPAFSKRYFFSLDSPPTPSTDVFLQKKPENGFRVFYLGESSAAGYPYGHNGMSSRVIQDVLTDLYPDKHVEVINMAMAAINSYTLFDMTDEILDQKPDAIMIYTGHNEYYGALGVGSNESLGAFPGFVRFYLKIQRLKTFLLLRDWMVKLAFFVSSKEIDQSKTLMERVVREQVIPLNSPIYDQGIRQFKSNMTALLNKYKAENVPVYLSTVASNLRDFPPFESLPGDSLTNAKAAFETGKKFAYIQENATAERFFKLAKDLDVLRFRAPEDINAAIRAMADSQHVFIVDAETVIKQNSPGGIPGNNWFLEHLHPNWQGNHLIARTFSEAFLREGPYKMEGMIFNPAVWTDHKNRMLVSEYDEQVAFHRLQVLYSGWPFRKVSTDRSNYLKTYTPVSLSDSLAIKSVHGKVLWAEAKLQLAEKFTSRKQFHLAAREYEGLYRDDPANKSALNASIRLYLDAVDYASSHRLLKRLNKIKPEFFSLKMEGIVAMALGKNDEAIPVLEQAYELQPRDAQLLYNLSGAYGVQKNFTKAKELLDSLLIVDPAFPGIDEWTKELNKHLGK